MHIDKARTSIKLAFFNFYLAILLSCILLKHMLLSVLSCLSCFFMHSGSLLFALVCLYCFPYSLYVLFINAFVICSTLSFFWRTGYKRSHLTYFFANDDSSPSRNVRSKSPFESVLK